MRILIHILIFMSYQRSSSVPSAALLVLSLVTATSGLSPLRDLHSTEFRPADIPAWLDASRERLLRAPRPLRLRLRCQREKRCRSKVRHKCRPYHRPGSLASGGQVSSWRAWLRTQPGTSEELSVGIRSCRRVFDD